MSCRHSIFCCAALAMLFCGSADAAFIVDRENNLDLAPDHIRIFVDEFYPPGEYPTTWIVRDGATGPHDPWQKRSQLVLPLNQLSGRTAFWIPRTQPTFYLEGFQSPLPEEAGDRSLTFHDLSIEALAGADAVTVDPAGPGAFTYISTAGTRSVTLDVLPRAPEPTGLLLGATAVVACSLLRRTPLLR